MKPTRRRFGLTVRTKVLLFSALLLTIPYEGYQYLREMEKYLRIGLENSLMGAARALAGAMHDRPALFEHSHRQPLESGDGLYLFNLEQPIQLDGYPDDWEPLLAQTQHFGNPDITQDNVNTDPLSFSHLLGKETYHLYALFLVRDKRIIYRSPETSDPNRADHLRLVFETSDGRRRRFILNTSSPGWVNATEITGDFNRPASLRPEISIKGEWQETADGYNLEVRIPLHMVGSRMAIAIVDVDDDAGDPIPEVLGTTNPTDKDGLTTLISPSPEIENLIRSLGRTPGRRVHVLDANGRILTQGGTLLRGPPATPAGFFHSLILSWPDENAIDGNGVMTHLRGEWINTALGGKPSVSWRAGQEKEMVIVSAAHPILGNGRILGGVVVEETTHSIQTVQRQALGDLFNTTLVVVSIGTLSLLFFANRLSGRIRRLRDSTDAAVDPYGRITGTLVPSTAADEIGDLSRCYAVMIERLRQHHQYLETMAGRLSHELRTPLAVVRSSLDNLELNSSTEDPQLFVTRAKQGVERLSTIITQMSEASRLEQTLQNTEIVTLDIVKLVKDCMDAYRYTWPETAIEWRGDMEPILVRGAADLLVQMLDKLVSNAIDFSDARQPVILQVHRQGSYVNILVQNSGQPIPWEIEGRLFESMVSIRPKRSGKEPHLGLGLYIVRLITEFHGGRVSARNLPKEICVEFSVQLPAKK